MPQANYDPDVQCPFYLYDEYATRKIFCEGLCGASSLNLNFRDNKRLRIQKARLCASNYKNCPIYQMNLAKYA